MMNRETNHSLAANCIQALRLNVTLAHAIVLEPTGDAWQNVTKSAVLDLLKPTTIYSQTTTILIADRVQALSSKASNC